MQAREPARVLKVITLGPPAAGKTCIILKSVNSGFALPDGYMCTLGVDFKVKTMEFEGIPVKLHIWDTAGQERFLHINRMYYRDTHGVILVFDVTDRHSFESIRTFWEDFKMYEGSQTIAKVLVGNKVDLERKVSQAEGEGLARELGVPYLESSAKSGMGIAGIFERLMENMKMPEEGEGVTKLKKDIEKEAGCAC